MLVSVVMKMDDLYALRIRTHNLCMEIRKSEIG